MWPLTSKIRTKKTFSYKSRILKDAFKVLVILFIMFFTRNLLPIIISYSIYLSEGAEPCNINFYAPVGCFKQCISHSIYSKRNYEPLRWIFIQGSHKCFTYIGPKRNDNPYDLRFRMKMHFLSDPMLQNFEIRVAFPALQFCRAFLQTIQHTLN